MQSINRRRRNIFPYEQKVKQGDIVTVIGFTSAFTSANKKDNLEDGAKSLDISKEIGIVLEVFDTDNAAWVFFPSVGKVYVKIEALEKIT